MQIHRQWVCGECRRAVPCSTIPPRASEAPREEKGILSNLFSSSWRDGILHFTTHMTEKRPVSSCVSVCLSICVGVWERQTKTEIKSREGIAQLLCQTSCGKKHARRLQDMNKNSFTVTLAAAAKGKFPSDAMQKCTHNAGCSKFAQLFYLSVREKSED